MEHNWLLYIAAFALAFSIALLTTPFTKIISKKLGAIDYPKSRGIHKEPMPLMGGLAIVAGFIVSMIVLMPFVENVNTRQITGFIIGAIIIVGLGIVDDIYAIGPKFKLFVQIIVALVVINTGTVIDFVMWPQVTYLETLRIPVTMIWIVGLINAVNFIDGVDGLAAGVTSIAAFCLMVLCILSGSQLAVVLTATLAGACLGFLPRNFSPAEVFMGDTGSTFLGYVLAVSSIIGVYKSYAILSVLIAVLAMALPILDTAFAMLRRAVEHRPIMKPDRGHLHHRLIDSGYTHKQAVGILYGLSFLSAAVAILIAVRDFKATIVVFVFFLVLLLMLYVYTKRTNN